MPKERLVGGGLILTTAVLVAVGFWQTAGRLTPGWTTVVHEPRAVMGTTCTMAAVVPFGDPARAQRPLGEAEAALRHAEARMSVWLADSEVSRLNAAKRGDEVPLSPETLAVLRAAERAAAETDGAFDVTCRPLLRRWRRAGEHGVLPTESELAHARAASNWDLLELTTSGAVKRADGMCVDLGGIAKGRSIDVALDVLRRAALDGAMVEVGGDLACFGRTARGGGWPVDVRDPFGPGLIAQLRVPEGAVATSGNYARYTEIAGKRYGHIVDPRSGRPADAVPSVTVVAPTAVAADVWATALAVLGPAGLGRMPSGVDALMIVGTRDDYRILSTPRARRLIVEPAPPRLVVCKDRPTCPGTSTPP